MHGWLISIAHHRFLQLRRSGGGALRLHDQFGRLDTPGDQELHLLALAYYCGESPARLAEISGLPQPAAEEALLSAITRLPELAREALTPAAPAQTPLPETDLTEAAPTEPEPEVFPTLTSLAATEPVTRVEPWEPPRKQEEADAQTVTPGATPPPPEQTAEPSAPAGSDGGAPTPEVRA